MKMRWRYICKVVYLFVKFIIIFNHIDNVWQTKVVFDSELMDNFGLNLQYTELRKVASNNDPQSFSPFCFNSKLDIVSSFQVFILLIMLEN